MKKVLFLTILFLHPRLSFAEAKSNLRIHYLPFVLYNLIEDNKIFQVDYTYKIWEHLGLGVTGGYINYYDGYTSHSENKPIDYRSLVEDSYRIAAVNIGMRLDFYFSGMFESGYYFSNALLLTGYESTGKQVIETSDAQHCVRKYNGKGVAVATALTAGYNWNFTDVNILVGIGNVRSKSIMERYALSNECNGYEDLLADEENLNTPWLDLAIGFHF